ncbi:Asx homology domain-containing protein [Lipomyces japonicus]|uniref:Asx homology domain-containing protein n=1 Tax=Lipomyces japonicus TaxID=56871 RepID=UPI0034CF01A4
MPDRRKTRYQPDLEIILDYSGQSKRFQRFSNKNADERLIDSSEDRFQDSGALDLISANPVPQSGRQVKRRSQFQASAELLADSNDQFFVGSSKTLEQHFNSRTQNWNLNIGSSNGAVDIARENMKSETLQDNQKIGRTVRKRKLVDSNDVTITDNEIFVLDDGQNSSIDITGEVMSDNGEVSHRKKVEFRPNPGILGASFSSVENDINIQHCTVDDDETLSSHSKEPEHYLSDYREDSLQKTGHAVQLDTLQKQHSDSITEDKKHNEIQKSLERVEGRNLRSARGIRKHYREVDSDEEFTLKALNATVKSKPTQKAKKIIGKNAVNSLLSSRNSLLTSSDLSKLFNTKRFNLLSANQRRELISLLPECDKTSDFLLGEEFFKLGVIRDSMITLQEDLSSGRYETRYMNMIEKARKWIDLGNADDFKEHQLELWWGQHANVLPKHEIWPGINENNGNT